MNLSVMNIQSDRRGYPGYFFMGADSGYIFLCAVGRII